MSDEDRFKTDFLDRLEKMLDPDKMPKARVGILGGHNARKEGNGPTNAEIGAKHEFGSDGMPIRSFLRMPIALRLQKELDGAGLNDKAVIKSMMRQGTLLPLLKKIAVAAEACVLDAFETGGFGNWKPSNMKYKKNHQTLVETQQLRNSITSEVK